MTELSFTDILYLTNTTPFEWYSKKQATCETATYGSALMAVRMCIEQIMNIRNTLRYLGIPMRWECFKFGDNDSVFNSASIHHTKIHKRHIALSFNRIREVITAGVMLFKFLPGKDNSADILSKYWGYQQVWNILQPIIIWREDTMDLIPNEKNDGVKGDETNNSPVLYINGE